MNKKLFFSLFIILNCFNPAFPQGTASKQKNSYSLSVKDVQWMHEATIQQLKGCQVEGTNGLWLHTPDGVGNYKALWTRDFYYMVEYAGNLMIPKEIKASIYYLINGQRADGCIPDRVNIDVKAVYSPGADNDPMADHAIDNGPFMALRILLKKPEIFCLLRYSIIRPVGIWKNSAGNTIMEIRKSIKFALIISKKT